MCYRTATPEDKEDIEREFQARIEFPEAYKPYYHLNSFSGEAVPVITWEDPKIVKLIPWKSHESFNSLNARCEDIFLPKKYFKKFNNRRGIMAVSGFYESYEIKKPGRKTGDKFPYFITLENKPCFAIACLISHFNTVSLLTTDANQMMREIHNNAKRMPVILHKEDYRTWLSQDITEEEVSVLMRPYESEKMNAHPVSKVIYSTTENNNVAKAKEKYKYAEADLPIYIEGKKIIEGSTLFS